MENKTEWDAKSYYEPPQDHPFAVILLNEALETNNVNFFTSIWQRASVRVLVDGATNHYHQLTETSKDSLKLPNFISGNFAHARQDLLTHYKELGVSVIPTIDEDETDFTKSLRELEKYVTKGNIQIKNVVVIAPVNNERFDHVLANLATLYKVESVVTFPVVVVSGASLFWLLKAGDHHTIKVTKEVVSNPLRSWCGLIPLGHPSTVTTTGLKWNLNNQVLGFGILVSTSNRYDPTLEGNVTITTDQPLLWTMGWDVEKIYPEDSCDASFTLDSCNKVDPSSSSVPVIKSKRSSSSSSH